MTRRFAAASFALLLFAAPGGAQDPGGREPRPEPPRQAAERLLRPLELPPEERGAAAEALVAKTELRERLRRKASALEAAARDPWTPDEEVALAARAYESAADEVRRTVEQIDARLRERVSVRAWGRLLAAGFAGTGLGFPELPGRAAGTDPGRGDGPWNADVVAMESADG
ncbi:MAG: hypothetical protein MUC63_09745, partial [Planctomycetes bacterium]|nr:hypothetical protein [Planctomycetota bacterium]